MIYLNAINIAKSPFPIVSATCRKTSPDTESLAFSVRNFIILGQSCQSRNFFDFVKVTQRQKRKILQKMAISESYIDKSASFPSQVCGIFDSLSPRHLSLPFGNWFTCLSWLFQKGKTVIATKK